jgi:hypothetical protein
VGEKNGEISKRAFGSMDRRDKKGWGQGHYIFFVFD